MMVDMHGDLLNKLEQFGYLGLFLGVFLESAGLPLPGETALLAAGFAASRGVMSLPLVMLVAAAAGILGDNLGYYVGRRLGRGALDRYGKWILITPGRLNDVDRFFERFGPMAVAAARFVAGVRVVAAFSAGIGRMRWGVFLVFNALGAAVWAATMASAGYLFGSAWQRLHAYLGSAGVALVLLIPLLLAAVYLFRRARERLFGPVEDEPAFLKLVGYHWTWILVMSLAAVGVFAKVTEDVVRHETAPFDVTIRHWILGHRTFYLYDLASGFNWLLNPLIFTVIAGVFGVWLWRRRGRMVAAVALLAPILAGGAILVLKLLIERPLPPAAPIHARLPAASFPAGATTLVTAVGATLAYVVVRQKLAPKWVGLIAAGLALIVGLARLYLDIHWATDVVGGWATGLLVAMVCAAVYEHLQAFAGLPATDKRTAEDQEE